MVHLLYATGESPAQMRCWNCGTLLALERCAANTSSGPRWFCKHQSDDPDESCYNIWKMRQPWGY
jgi:hypothetical protein